MRKVFDYVNGLYSLGMGSPFYRHSAEEKVPWTLLDHPLRNASEGERAKWIAAGGDPEEIDREIRRLGRPVPGEILSAPLISNSLYKPGRVIYTTLLPHNSSIGSMEALGAGKYRWRVVDPDFSVEGGGATTPGHCILREFRLVLPENIIIEKISLSAGRLVKRHLQTFWKPETGVVDLLQRYLGLPLVIQVSPQERCVTIPFFFSRDPMYGLPIFAVGEVEIVIQLSQETEVKYLTCLEVLHSREEVRQVRASRLHRVEDLTSPWTTAEYTGMERWIYANCFWREGDLELVTRDNETVEIRLLHEGGLDEEIKGVFWKISKGVGEVKVGLEYRFEGDRSVSLVDIHPSAILSELDLRTRIIPTTSGSFLTPRETRADLGGFLCSKYVDSVDCEPGISPRNGELILTLRGGIHKEDVLGIYLLTSRDITVV